MQLSFLGQAYTASTAAATAIPTEDTAVFMGQCYTRKQFTTVTQRQSPVERIYRGIRYTS
jgi:hypothetical protein